MYYLHQQMTVNKGHLAFVSNNRHQVPVKQYLVLVKWASDTTCNISFCTNCSVIYVQQVMKSSVNRYAGTWIMKKGITIVMQVAA